jgi:hypothetical protein
MIMSKIQFKNLYHTFRWARNHMTIIEALAWIGFYNRHSRYIIERVIG